MIKMHNIYPCEGLNRISSNRIFHFLVLLMELARYQQENIFLLLWIKLGKFLI